MVRLDDGALAETGLDDVRIDCALDEIIDSADFAGFFLENADEFLADYMTLAPGSETPASFE